MNVFVFICIGVECLRTFCSVLFGFRKCNKINDIAHPLRIHGISVTSTPGTPLFHLWNINSIKPMRASDLPMFLYGAETWRCASSGPRATDTRLLLAHQRLMEGLTNRSIPLLIRVAQRNNTGRGRQGNPGLKNTRKSNEEELKQVRSNSKQRLID